MESDFEHRDSTGRGDSAAAAAALSALHADRQVLADRIRTPAWYYPLLGIATALIIGSPGAGLPGQPVMVAFGCLGIVFLSLAHRRITGMTITRMAGPKSLAVSVLLGVMIVLLLGVSLALAATGHPQWVVATAAASCGLMWGGGALYEAVYDRELRSGR